MACLGKDVRAELLGVIGTSLALWSAHSLPRLSLLPLGCLSIMSLALLLALVCVCPGAVVASQAWLPCLFAQLWASFLKLGHSLAYASMSLNVLL